MEFTQDANSYSLQQYQLGEDQYQVAEERLFDECEEDLTAIENALVSMKQKATKYGFRDMDESIKQFVRELL